MGAGSAVARPAPPEVSSASMTLEERGHHEWKAGWRVVVACAAGMGLTTMHFYSLGLFITPLAKAYGWSHAQITAGPAISSVVLFFVASRVGRLADRIGVRRIAITGFIGYCLGVAALGLAGPSIWSWYGLWLLIAVCHPLAGIAVWSLAIASRFDRSRGLALATALSGPGVVATLAPVTASYLIGRFGWSASYAILGGSALLIALPVLFAWLRSAHDVKQVQAAREGLPPSIARGMTFQQALRSRAFWSLFVCAAVIGTGISALIVHFVPMALERGISATSAAAVSGLIGFCAIGSRLVTGILMDRLPGRIVGGVLFLMPACACALLLAPGGVGLITAAAIAIGLALGAEFDVLAVLVSRYLGMRSYGAIYGQIVATFGVGIGFGPAIGGLLFDHTSSYRQLLLILGVLFLIPSLLSFLLGRVPTWSTTNLEPDLEVTGAAAV
jgi:MFS family permease